MDNALERRIWDGDIACELATISICSSPKVSLDKFYPVRHCILRFRIYVQYLLLWPAVP